MTTSDNDNDPPSRPISVAELLAKNGSIGAPPPTSGRRRRRRGDTDSVTVAELTGEIPIISDDAADDDQDTAEPSGDERDAQSGRAQPDHEDTRAPRTNGSQTRTDVGRQEQSRPIRRADPRRGATETARLRPVDRERVPHSFEPSPARRTSDTGRAPKAFDPRPSSRSGPPPRQTPPRDVPADDTDVQPSLYPGDDLDELRGAHPDGAEGMAFDPVLDEADPDADSGYDGDAVDLHKRDEPGAALDDAGHLRGQDSLFGGQAFDDEPVRARSLSDLDDEIDSGDEFEGRDSGGTSLLHYGLIVGQSIVAVIFGAGMFLAFDQLWQWNPIVALVLSVLVVLGLVVGVRVVRKTEDIASTLIAVAVGLLVCLGPLALLR